jgi:ABC-type branched-subunit amino acid transport system substrate-binding protein
MRFSGRRVKEYGGEIVAAEAQLIDQTDFSAIVTTFKAANPEAIVILTKTETDFGLAKKWLRNFVGCWSHC